MSRVRVEIAVRDVNCEDSFSASDNGKQRSSDHLRTNFHSPPLITPLSVELHRCSDCSREMDTSAVRSKRISPRQNLRRKIESLSVTLTVVCP